MKILLPTLLASIFAVSTLHAATVNPDVDYGQGQVLFTTPSDAFYSFTPGSGNNAFLFFGTFSTLPTASSTAQDIEDDFNRLGLSDVDVYVSGEVFSSDVSDSDFNGAQGYLVAANNSDIGSASEIAIVTSPGWTFNNPTLTTDSLVISSTDLASGSGSTLVLGSYGAGGPGYDTIQLAVVPIPEPSSIALLGLGAVAFAFRRRK